jgi:cytoplasmic polyadenylation element-binding protein
LNQPTQAQQQQQEAQQRQQEQQAFQYSQAEIKQLQAFQAFQILQQQQQQQLQQQLNSAPIQQILQQQILNRFNQVQQMQSWRQPAANGNGGNGNNNTALDHAAKYHRSSAALYDASCTWSGVLPPRSHRFITYSPKVFLGGIPWDISEQTLMQILKPFGQIRIEWPGKEQNAAQPKGYVYVIFESEKQVKSLLQACSIQDNFSGSSSGESTGSIPSLCSSSVSGNTNGNYYYKISSKRIKEKEVEVIPWIIGDSNYIKNTNQKLDSTKTVFVGALHGKLTAEALAKIMNDLFDGVVYAGIDTDKYKYPIGSGRVTFNNMRSYMRAVSAAFIEIKTSKFTKKVQVDPYLEDSLCSMCGVQHGPYYCRELSCFR